MENSAVDAPSPLLMNVEQFAAKLARKLLTPSDFTGFVRRLAFKLAGKQKDLAILRIF
jgi:nucleolar pre-ribosomal-associated protein 1